MRARPSTVERRCAGQTTDVRAHTDRAARTCAACGCVWLDYPDGRDAHLAVFGHGPKANGAGAPNATEVTEATG